MRPKLRELAFAFMLVAASVYTGLFGAVNGNAQTSVELEISKNWMRETPPAAMAAGGFLMITNTSDQDDTLISVEFAGAKNSMIHEMTVDNGVMKMRHLENGIIIPAGGSATLKPGANHLMFMGLKSPLIAGDIHSIKLIFEKSGELVVDFPVKDFIAGKKFMQQGN